VPLSKLQFKPGINRENTNYAGEGGWYDGDKIRFRSGFPEKIGGWQNLAASVNGVYNTYKGVCRNLTNWITQNSSNLLALGTEQKLYVENGGAFYDITPVRAAVTINNNPFAITTGSKLVTVTDTAHLITTGTYVTFSGATGADYLVFNAEYEIIAVPTANTYQIILATAATATGSGGGAVVSAVYQINAGNSVSVVGTGWGTGPWSGNTTYADFTATIDDGTPPGAGTVMTVSAITSGTITISMLISGTGIAAATTVTALGTGTGGVGTYTVSVSQEITSTSGIVGYLDGWGEEYSGGTAIVEAGRLRLWTIDSYGQDLVAAVREGAIYYWAADTTTSPPRAVTVESLATAEGYDGTFVPNQVYEISTSGVQRFTIALGSNPYDPTDAETDFDPMLVRWSDQENTYQWVPSATNQSGELRLSHGSQLVTGRYGRQEFVIWSDSAIYAMQYLGPPYVWGVNLLMDGISIASPNGVAGASNIMFWMGIDKFYMYDGRVQTLPCTVRQFVFDDFNFDQRYQVVAGGNEQYSEVWWHYPSQDSTVNDRYVIYNYLDSVWYYGALNRTAWLDSALRNNPMGAFSIKTSYLSAAVDDTVTTLNLIDASTYPETGTVTIDSEEITYTSRTATALSGCTRGVNSTTAASHVAYSTVAFLVTNQIMSHEVGNDDNSTATLVPIEAYVDSSDFDIGDGHNFGFVWRIIPDLTFDGSTTAAPSYPEATMVCKPRQFSGSAYGVPSSPSVTSTQSYNTQRTYTVQQFTGQVYTRVRGRQMSFEIRSTGQGVAWQLGAPRIDIRPDGKR
jgi:hypothetical protein